MPKRATPAGGGLLHILAILLALPLAGAAMAQDAPAPPVAQDAPAPPVVASEAPALPGTGAGTDAPPSLPQIIGPAEAAVVPPAGESAEPAIESDLVAIVLTAHPVVQGVMALLAAAIFAVLTVFLFKAVEFALAFRRLRRTAQGLAAGPGLVALAGACPLATAARAARDEAAGLPLPLSADLRAAARERLDLSLARIEAGAVQRLRSGSGLLASIGAVAPFVGLFGTVFGIMNSFLAIAATRTTNLAVVAPGIAEALLATGIGLAAAIPAVLLYNRLMRRIAAFRHALADGTAELLRRFSREMDARMGAGAGG